MEADMVFISTASDIHCYNIRRVSAYLKKFGYKVKIIFLPQPFANRYGAKVLEQMVDLCKGSKLVGISFMSNYWYNSKQIIKALRESSPETLVIGGGPHPTTNPEQCLEEMDFICIGEGDDTLLELLTRVVKGIKDYSGIINLVYKQNGKIFRNQSGKFEKIELIGTPDYDLEDHYILFKGKIIPMTYRLFRCFYGEVYATQMAFGCPFTCSFCIHNIINKQFKYQHRMRPIKNVLSELQEIYKKFPFFRELRIDDDTFFFYSKEELEEFRDGYVKVMGLPIYVTGGQPMVIREEKLKPMVEAGMYRLRMGIQSGSSKIQKLYQRNYPNWRILEACKTINKFKDRVRASYDIITDNPWETDEDKLATLILAMDIPHPYSLSVFSLAFFPNTDIHKQALEDGKISKDYDVLSKHYSGMENNYLNLMYSVVEKPYIPRKFKEFLLKKSVRESVFAPLIKHGLKFFRLLLNRMGLTVQLFSYIKRLDLVRVKFSIEKFVYDYKYYYSSRGQILGGKPYSQ